MLRAILIELEILGLGLYYFGGSGGLNNLPMDPEYRLVKLITWALLSIILSNVLSKDFSSKHSYEVISKGIPPKNLQKNCPF